MQRNKQELLDQEIDEQKVFTSNGSPYATGPLSCLSYLSLLSVCNVGVLWPNGWMDQDATCYGDRPRPRRHYVRWGPGSPTEWAQQPPTFRPMSIVAKTVAYLSNC